MGDLYSYVAIGRRRGGGGQRGVGDVQGYDLKENEYIISPALEVNGKTTNYCSQTLAAQFPLYTLTGFSPFVEAMDQSLLPNSFFKKIYRSKTHVGNFPYPLLN